MAAPPDPCLYSGPHAREEESREGNVESTRLDHRQARAGRTRAVDQGADERRHEFRTSLNSIQALTRLLLERADGDLTGEQTRQVEFIRKAAQDLTELVNDLLTLSRTRP